MGVIWGRGNIGMRCESLIKERVRVWALDWLVCISKVCLQEVFGLQELASPGKHSLSRIKASNAKAFFILFFG